MKRGLNGFLIRYELCGVELRFLVGQVGSVRRRAELGRQPLRVWRGQAGQLGRAGVGGGDGWLLGRARLTAGFRSTVSFVI
jgi:hypothetical protein